MERYTIKKINMLSYLLGFSRGIAWEVRDNVDKKILDAFPTKAEAEKYLKSYLDMINNPSEIEQIIFGIIEQKSK